MLTLRRFAAPAAALTLAIFPAGALAQSAGDDQYSDPFGDEEQSQSSGGSGGGSGSGSGNSSGSAGAAAQSATPAPSTQAAPAASSGAAASTAQGEELPRTGLDAGVVAAIGAGLLGMGLVLRRRTADGRR